MTDKYSFSKCEQYGRRLAARLCNQHFNSTSDDSTLDGPDILRFTPVRQVNLLVVHQLLQQWQAEMSRLRSPYFDFEAPAVQTALVQFQNTLSRYIRLTQDVFEPLLAHATAQTLGLVTDPTSAFEQLFSNQYSEVSPSQLRDILRYVDLNKDFFNSFIDTLPAGNPIANDVFISQLRAYQAANYRAYQPVQQLVATFSSLLPLTEADLREEGPASSLSVAPPSAVLAASSSSPVPVTARAEATSITRKPVNEAGPQKTAAAVPGTLLDAAADTPLHEKLKATQSPTTPLAATLRAAQSQPTPLAERSAPKVETLREAISINQRFSFINELFNGENMEYHAAIQHLDTLTDFEQARLYLTHNLAQRYDWSRKEEHVTKLLKLVERKFSQV